jgi:plasmid stability protein
MEQILIRKLPPGTKAALRALADQHQLTVEAQARQILADALAREPLTLVDLLADDQGDDIDFVPERLGLTAHTPTL